MLTLQANSVFHLNSAIEYLGANRYDGVMLFVPGTPYIVKVRLNGKQERNWKRWWKRHADSFEAGVYQSITPGTIGQYLQDLAKLPGVVRLPVQRAFDYPE